MNVPIIPRRPSLKQQVAKVMDLEKRIKKYNPSYQGNPLFAQHASYFTDPPGPGNGDDPAVTGEENGLAWQIIKVLEAYNQSVDKTAEFIEKFADLIQIEGVQLGAILSLLGFSKSSQENQFEPYFLALMNAIAEARAATTQGDLHYLMGLIGASISSAKSAAQGATQWVSLGKPSFNDYFPGYDRDSRQAVDDMMIPARWVKIWDVTDYSKWESKDYKPWTTFIAIYKYGINSWANPGLDELASLIPRETGGLVWTYQLALPALLYTINARLAVLRTFYPDFRNINQIYKDEINVWINFLYDEVLRRFNNAIWIEEPENWYNISFGPRKGHYCCNLYTGEFVTGNPDKDAKFIQQHGHDPVSPELKDFLANRFLALNTPLLSGVLTTLASLHQMVVVWHDWQDLGGRILGDVGVVNLSTKLFELFVRGTDNRLWTSSFVLNGKNIPEWKLLDDSKALYSAPVAVSKNSGHRSIFATTQNGTYGNVMHKLFQDNQWHAWEDLSYVIKGDVGAVAPGGDVIDLYVRGIDDALYESYFTNGKWSNWSLLDNSMKLASSPVAVSNDANHRAIYVYGADGMVHHKYWDGKQWHAWENLGRPPKQATNNLPIVDIGAVSDKNGITDLFVRGDDLKLWQKTYNNGWSDWTGIEQTNFQFQSAPVAIAVNSSHRGIFVRGWDGKVYHKYWGE